MSEEGEGAGSKEKAERERCFCKGTQGIFCRRGWSGNAGGGGELGRQGDRSSGILVVQCLKIDRGFLRG